MNDDDLNDSLQMCCMNHFYGYLRESRQQYVKMLGIQTALQEMTYLILSCVWSSGCIYEDEFRTDEVQNVIFCLEKFTSSKDVILSK